MQSRNKSQIFLILTTLCCILCVTAAAQPTKWDDLDNLSPTQRAELKKTQPLATVALGGAEINWKPYVEYERLVLTVSLPDGEVFRQEFESGSAPSFKLAGEKGGALPDGLYGYELRLTPNLPDEVKEALKAARENDNDAAVGREMKRQGKLPKAEIVQTGSFLIEKGIVHMGSAEKAGAPRKVSRNHEFSNPVEPQNSQRERFRVLPAGLSAFDQVIPDDLIVQGSACVGLDCVNNESFGFDTIRLKENNLRIKFEDTSVGAFPTTDWQLTANDSVAGGANKFSIEDITAARVPFTITGGAATNSIFVDSTGRVGLRTSTPVLDLHVNTSNSPAHRLEQNSSGGFTAQTWDVAGNEANFFVRDVTGGSRLPFRIRPGAPTSSIDIAADGSVGIGTASPAEELHIRRDLNGDAATLNENVNNGTAAQSIVRVRSVTAETSLRAHSDTRTAMRFGVTIAGFTEALTTAGNGFIVGTNNNTPLIMGTNGQNRLHIASGGNIGLGGVANATQNIQHSSGATLTGAVWTNGSSRALKTNIRNLSARDARTTLQALNPVTYQYKASPGESFVGFIAEDVPELVATNDRKGLSPMDVVAVLTKVMQEQQQVIADLKIKVERLEMAQAKKVRRYKKQ